MAPRCLAYFMGIEGVTHRPCAIRASCVAPAEANALGIVTRIEWGVTFSMHIANSSRLAEESALR
eukprot:219144-Amphidinium_carterae.1